MRQLNVSNIMSLDGYFEGPGGNVMVLPMDEAFDAYCAERLRAADTLLLGRKTYDGFKGFWPTMAYVPSAYHREISQRDDAIQKIVVSDTMTEDDTDPWRETTRIVRQADAHEQLAALKAGEGNDILVFGSRTLWNDLLAAGLVDELHLMAGQALLGAGTPVVEGDAPVSLRLLESRVLDGSGLVLTRYDANP